MSHAGLSLHQAPPLSAPMRFFLTAPAFGLFAACILAWTGPDIFSSRLAPPALAFTHALTLGFISMAMFGAMQQLMPVLVGVPARRPGMLGTMLHGLLGSGTLALTLGLLADQKALLMISLPLLLLAFAFFLGYCFTGLARAKAHTATVVCMWLACASLVIAIGLGLFFGIRRILTGSPYWGDVHYAWALMGWVGLMVTGVAYEVVPMFQLTPAYPAWMRRWLAPVLFACLIVHTAVRLLPEAWRYGPLHLLAPVSLLAGFSAFALSTLRLQRQRRRRVPDITVAYWRLGMTCLIIFSLLWLSGTLSLPVVAKGLDMEIFLGLLLIIGVICSLICGMLYKIIPFLLWFHLQGSLEEYLKLPSMKELLPDAPARRQFYVHVASLAALLAASIRAAWFTYPASLLLAVSNIMLGLNMWAACRKYRGIKAMLSSPAEGPGNGPVQT